MMAELEDKAGAQAQRLAWEAVKKSINGLVNKVNAPNIKNILPELFRENLVRGRWALAGPRAGRRRRGAAAAAPGATGGRPWPLFRALPPERTTTLNPPPIFRGVLCQSIMQGCHKDRPCLPPH